MTPIIQVKATKGGFKILINYLQRGIIYTSVQIANREAQNLKEKEIPNAKLILVKE